MAKLLAEDEYNALLADALRYQAIRKEHEQWGGSLLVLRIRAGGFDTGLISQQPGALDVAIDKFIKEGK